jgi:putative acyl-CoA dehydrogenase
MRQALASALWHAAHRRASQKKLIYQPLMRAVPADMAIDSEAATSFTFRIVQILDANGNDLSVAAFSRIATPIAKFWINKRFVNFIYEAMEVRGGVGYVEESVMPRLFRQSSVDYI